MYSKNMIKKAIAINIDYITPLGLTEMFFCFALIIAIVMQAFAVASSVTKKFSLKADNFILTN